MTHRAGTRLTTLAVLVAIVVLTLFSPVGPVPPAGGPSLREAAGSQAAGGVDASGRARPLLVHAGGEVWLQPIPVYALSALIGAGMEAGTAARLMAGVSGALSAWLVFLLGLRLFARPTTALVSAAIFVLSPGYLALGAAGSAALAALPPVLAWLLAVVTCLERPRPPVLALGAAALALGFYTHPVGVLMVPVFLAMGLIVLRHHLNRRLLLATALGLAAPMSALVVWYWQHPATWVDTMGRWAVHLAHIRDPWQGLRTFTRWDVMGRRAGDYWHVLSPVYLFMSGSVFLSVAAVLVPLGLAGRSLTRSLESWWLLFAAFLAAPFAAVLLDEPRSIERAVALLPFGALLAALGVERLWRHESVAARVLLALLTVLGVADLIMRSS